MPEQKSKAHLIAGEIVKMIKRGKVKDGLESYPHFHDFLKENEYAAELLDDLSDADAYRLPAADRINDATLITVANEEEVIYFVDTAGDVWSRMLNESGTETLEFDVPGDETVTFVRQIRHNNTALPVNYIAVGTSKGSGAGATYTVRFFNKLGGRFENENEGIRLTGSGYPRDVNFINPSLYSHHTYYEYLYR